MWSSVPQLHASKLPGILRFPIRNGFLWRIECLSGQFHTDESSELCILIPMKLTIHRGGGVHLFHPSARLRIEPGLGSVAVPDRRGAELSAAGHAGMDPMPSGNGWNSTHSTIRGWLIDPFLWGWFMLKAHDSHNEGSGQILQYSLSFWSWGAVQRRDGRD